MWSPNSSRLLDSFLLPPPPPLRGMGAGISGREGVVRAPFVFQNGSRHSLQVVLNPCGIPVRFEVEAPVRRPLHGDLRYLDVAAIAKEDPVGWDFNEGGAFERELPERPFLSHRDPEMGRACPQPLEFLERRFAVRFLFPHLDGTSDVSREGADSQ